MSSLGNVAALIAAICTLQLGQALLGVVLPLGMKAEGHDAFSIGLMGSAYSAGFMVGAWYAPRMLAHVGHIRIFAAAAAVAGAATIAVHWAGPLIAWAVPRALGGAAIALMFASAESWMQASLDKSRRGDVMGIYMVCIKIALALGPFLSFGAPAAAPEPLMLGAMLLVLAILPVCLTSSVPPPPPQSQPLALGTLFATAPAAVIACFGAGVMNAGVLAVAPAYAEDHFGPGSAPAFMAAAILGSLLTQWPAGRISDRLDRRLVIAALMGLSIFGALGLAVFGEQLRPRYAGLLFAVWGAGALSFYGLAVAHMADRADKSALAQASSGLLFVWAGGAVVGPTIAGQMLDLLGGPGLWGFAALAGLVLALAMVWRRLQRAAAALDIKAIFSPKQATSVPAAELTYGAQSPPEQGELPLDPKR